MVLGIAERDEARGLERLRRRRVAAHRPPDRDAREPPQRQRVLDPLLALAGPTALKAEVEELGPRERRVAGDVDRHAPGHVGGTVRPAREGRRGRAGLFARPEDDREGARALAALRPALEE